MKPQRDAKGHFIKQGKCTCTPDSPFLWHIDRQPSQMSLTEPAWKLKLAEQASAGLQARRDNGTSAELNLPGSAPLHHGRQVAAYSKAVSR